MTFLELRAEILAISQEYVAKRATGTMRRILLNILHETLLKEAPGGQTPYSHRAIYYENQNSETSETKSGARTFDVSASAALLVRRWFVISS
jgi:hypothetical protein